MSKRGHRFHLVRDSVLLGTIHHHDGAAPSSETFRVGPAFLINIWRRAVAGEGFRSFPGGGDVV